MASRYSAVRGTNIRGNKLHTSTYLDIYRNCGAGFVHGKKLKTTSVMNPLEYVLCGVLVLANFCLGIYFSFTKQWRHTASASAVLEVFLGSRTLMMLPLATSTVASIVSSAGLVVIPAHYYAYGWHLMWVCLTALFLLPLATHVFVPVIYGLEITSIFQNGAGPDNAFVICASTGKAAVAVGGTTVHSAFKFSRSKAMDAGLSDSELNTFRVAFRHVKVQE
ncbi:hypothetical protein HPB50_020882 [Hyalomma asiaticum]|uniref:Uncharacterized protein n=1 Tax=Hyalomma asiaticum TaxID=266040 RepID=A0ACB7T8Q8_HYAAI|nr:hypothetical protein HPB50_020882 [Hyalomma asiaticum]